MDHKNGDGCDCRKDNLRRASTVQNGGNRGKSRGEFASKFKGVSWHKQTGKWRAYIKRDYVQHHLGLFKDEKQAAKAYDKAAQDYFGQFALLNFPVDKS